MADYKIYRKYPNGGSSATAGTGGDTSLSESGMDAYMNRGVLIPCDFRDIIKSGSYRIETEGWEGFSYAPYQMLPFGHLQAFVNGPDVKLEYTDDEGNFAQWEKKDGVWVIDEESNPGGWEYLPTQPVVEFDEQGNQLGITGKIKAGKMIEFHQFAIKPGEIFKGLLPQKNVLSGVPVLASGQKVQSINRTYIFYVPDWDEITDKPSNLTGSGFLKLSYYDGIVHFQAFDFADGDTHTAYATIAGVGQPMSRWRIDSDLYATIDMVYNLLSVYALKEHSHDERYYIKSEINNLLAGYKPYNWLPQISEVAGLQVALYNKINIEIFQSAQPGYGLVLGPDSLPIAVDMSDPYVTAEVLPNGQEGSAYSYTIPDVFFKLPDGAVDVYVRPSCHQNWVKFEGAIIPGGSGSGLTVKTAPAAVIPNAKDLIISLDICFKRFAGAKEEREQRIVFVGIEPSAAVITTPTAPTGLSATAVSPTQIDLAWTDNSTNESGFNVYRSLSSGSGYALIGIAAANAVSYQDKTCLPNTHYYYRVTAMNSNGESSHIQDDDTTPDIVAPVTGGLHGNYFDTTDITAAVTPDTSRTDIVINLDLTATSPSVDVTNGAYFVRWSGYIKPPIAGNIAFTFGTNAQTRIWFGGALVVDAWTNGALTTFGFSRQVAALEEVPIVIEYLQTNVNTYARLGYINGSADSVVPTTWLVPEEFDIIETPVLTAVRWGAHNTIRLSWTQTVNPTSWEVFGGLDDDGVLPLLTNVLPAPDARSCYVTELPENLTFFFEIRAVTAGVFGPTSNRASASTIANASRPNGAAPLTVTRTDLTTLSFTWSDNNTGDTETYEFRFRENNTTAYKYYAASGQLSDDPDDAQLDAYPTGTNRQKNLSNEWFRGKRMWVEARVHKDGLVSDWTNVLEAEQAPSNQVPDVVKNNKFEPRQAADGTWYDAKAETDNNAYHNFYLPEDVYGDVSLFNTDGTPVPFSGIRLPGGAFFMIRKLRLRKSVYPTIQSWLDFGYLANSVGGNPSYIEYNAQVLIRTFGDEDTPGSITPPVITPDPEPTGRVIDRNTAVVAPIILEIMSYTSWKIDYVKACALAAKNSGHKAIQISFSPYRVWSNFTSAGAFNADALTWDWTNVNTIINYVCNDLGLKLVVRLCNNMSDFSLANMATNAGTSELTSAWGSYFDKTGGGSIRGLKADNLSAPPWMLYRRFCAAFKAQYNTYWNTGKILAWEFAYNTNQEAQPNPNDTTFPTPDEAGYIAKTEEMYNVGQMMLSIMSGWDDHFWNCGSFVNSGSLLKQNSMGYDRFAEGFKGLRGNHGSDWSRDLRDFMDLVLYSRQKEETGRYFAVEYFRGDNVSTAAALAAAIKATMDNGAWIVGYVFDNGSTEQVPAFYNEMAAALGTSYLSRPIGTRAVVPTYYDFSLSFMYNGGGEYNPNDTNTMFGEYMANKNRGNLPQYMRILV